MVNSETPACRNAPVKSSLVNACVFFKKPSVLSEFDRSAEETIMFSTSVASTPRTLAEALRVASPAFCSIAFQFTFGALPENHSSNLAASSGLALVHSALAAYFLQQFFQFFCTFGIQLFYFREDLEGLVGSPPKFLIVLM